MKKNALEGLGQTLCTVWLQDQTDVHIITVLFWSLGLSEHHITPTEVKVIFDTWNHSSCATFLKDPYNHTEMAVIV